MRYGNPPINLGEVLVSPSEYCFALYMPIFINSGQIRIPQNLIWTSEIVKRSLINYDDFYGKFVYLTAKYFYVSGESANRPGWHSDGFLTDDINYVWCDSSPTEYCVQDFDLTPEHCVSLDEMRDQAKKENIICYPEKSLLKLDQSVIHRAPFCNSGFRAFVKVSVSENRYNLKGNAHNHLLDYSWPLSDRSEIRNHPTKEK